MNGYRGTQKLVGGWCGDLSVHPAHQDCTGVEPVPFSPPDNNWPDVRDLMHAAAGRSAGEVFALHATQEAQDGLAETFAEILDNAMHLEACWISEDETRCQCIIGALRAVLPRCGHIERVGTKGLTRQCLRTVHPSAAYKHAFGTV